MRRAAMIPVGMAFIFRSTQSDRPVAYYPSPAGATESLLTLEHWDARVLADARREIRNLNRRQLALLLLVALIGGSVAYALNFRGLQISGAVTASLTGHAQFLFVAVIAWRCSSRHMTWSSPPCGALSQTVCCWATALAIPRAFPR